MPADDGFGGYAAFVDRSTLKLRRVAYAMGVAPDDVDDFVQEALTRTASRWSPIAAEKTDSYVLVVLLNLIRTNRRRQAVFGRIRHLTATPEAQDSSQAGQALADTLMQVLGHLPPRQRKVIVLRYCYDLSEGETARLLHVSAGTVKSQASRGLARLRAALALQEGNVDYV